MQSRGQQQAGAPYVPCWVEMRPGTLCCGACTCTNISSSNKIQRNCKRLKITVCIWVVGVNCGQDTKLPLLRSQEQRQSTCTHTLYTHPPKGWAHHLCQPSDPTAGHTPQLTPCKESAHPSGGLSRQGNLLFVLLPLCCSRAPIRPSLNFLPGFWSISIDQGSQESWLVTERSVGCTNTYKNIFVAHPHRLMGQQSRSDSSCFSVSLTANRNVLWVLRHLHCWLGQTMRPHAPKDRSCPQAVSPVSKCIHGFSPSDPIALANEIQPIPDFFFSL